MKPSDADPVILLRPFRPEDQDAAKALILAGLEEHWGSLDLSLNPDLNDIATFYAGGVFLVALSGAHLIGTGALLPAPLGSPPDRGRLARSPSAQIVRMSVAAAMRRHGIGRRILTALCDHARDRGIRNLTLETTTAWHNVIAFYRAFGFQETHVEGEDTYFELELNGESD